MFEPTHLAAVLVPQLLQSCLRVPPHLLLDQLQRGARGGALQLEALLARRHALVVLRLQLVWTQPIAISALLSPSKTQSTLKEYRIWGDLPQKQG